MAFAVGSLNPLTSAAVLSSIVYFGTGLPGWAVGAVLVLSFLGFGGWRTVRLAIRTLPRDVKLLLVYKKTLDDFKRWKETTVADLFSKMVARHPDKNAILFEDQCWTFRQLDSYANKIAHFFLEQGLKRGDTVAMFMENCPEYIGLWLGLSKIGVQSSFINYNLRESGLVHCLRICEPKAIVYSDSLGEALRAVHGELEQAVEGKIFPLKGEDLLHKSQGLEEELRGMSSNPPSRPKGASSRDSLCYIYTSGTTGLPKAVPVSNMRFLYMSNLKHITGITPDDIIYCVLPLYHSNGGVLTAGQMVIEGCTLVLRRKFSASQFWNDCVKYKCTTFFYIGEVCRYLLAQPDRPADTQHCIQKMIGNGLRPQIWTQFQKRFNIPHIYEFYGSTEGNCAMINTTGQPGACGFNSLFLPITEANLIKVDPETGEHVRDSKGFCVSAGVNEPGEVVGAIGEDAHEAFQGYHDPDATKKKILRNVFKSGDAYFLSGDMMRLDEEGYFYFCDRTGDTFRWKGENVSTNEVEGLTSRTLELRDVVVFGVDIPGVEGKAGMACIVGTEEFVDVKGLAKKLYRVLPAYAVPLFIRLIQQADMTGTFKFQKTRLRAEGYNIEKVSDPLFILDTSKKSYLPLDEDKYQQLQKGELRL